MGWDIHDHRPSGQTRSPRLAGGLVAMTGSLAVTIIGVLWLGSDKTDRGA
jgi:hypothetical protein